MISDVKNIYININDIETVINATIRWMALLRSPSQTLIGHLLIQYHAQGHVVGIQTIGVF